MTYNPRDLDRIIKLISIEIENSLIQGAIFHRIFYRCKSSRSLQNKLALRNDDGTPKYGESNKLLRDVLGIRINLYFVEDLEIVTSFLKEKYGQQFIEETIDENNTTEFKPTRTNIIYKLTGDAEAEFREILNDSRIDATFELQLRTVFSEGWHEVEHDLRYKCRKDWENYSEFSRTFNGVLASLETHDWSMIQLFERLSYSHYKQREISAMVRTKLRLRFVDFFISDNFLELIKSNDRFSKGLFKVERIIVVNFLLRNKLYFPLTLENAIYLINYFFIGNEEILEKTSQTLLENFALVSKPTVLL